MLVSRFGEVKPDIGKRNSKFFLRTEETYAYPLQNNHMELAPRN